MPSEPTFTRKQFLARSKKAKKLLNWAVAAWLVWFIGAQGIVSLFLPVELRDKPVFEDFRLAVGAFGHLSLSLLLLFWGLNAIHRHFGVSCPTCGSFVTASSVTIASGNCGHCGSQVLQIDNSSGGAT